MATGPSGFTSNGQMIDDYQNATEELNRDKVREAIDINNNNACDLATPDIKDRNDRHLAQFLSTCENESNIEKDTSNLIVIGKVKRIALVAHNKKKPELIECLRKHRNTLAKHKLYGTGTTGTLVQEKLGLPVTKFASGPLGGDQELGAKITNRELDILIFFVDPLDCHPHIFDVHALLRVSQVYSIICATTATTVDFILTSNMMDEVHVREINL